MPNRRNGLYYESKDIRNTVLSRNIGEYEGYKYSMLYNGGLAIGMPYAVETELVPYPIEERAMKGLQLSISSGQVGITGKLANPHVSLSWKEGGLFGYTHEVINNEYDWLSRNKNIIESFYDYDSTEELMKKLDSYPNSLPWGQGNDVFGGTESGGLRAFSSNNDPQNSVYYNDYTDYVREIFTNGLSFDKHLGDHYVTNLLYDGFNRENVDTGVRGFIEEKARYITDNTDELKGIADTKLGYIGKILLDEEKVKQVDAMNDRRWSGSDFEYNYVHTPITDDIDLNLGLGTGNENDYMIGISAFNEPKIAYRKFIVDQNDVINDTLSFAHKNFQQDLLRKHIKSNIDSRINLIKRGGYADLYIEGKYASYAKLTNLDANSGLSVDADIMSDAKGDPTYTGKELHTGSTTSERVYHEYDERDESGKEIRDTLNADMSYGTYTYSGINYGDSSNLLAKTRELFAKHKINTLVGRFHTSGDNSDATEIGLIQTAVDKTWGISHGRNLLKTSVSTPNDYTNPYCRVWTYHHQYSKMTDLIRPFVNTDGDFVSINELQAKYPARPIISKPAGTKGWEDKTVLNKNGMVNIAPSNRENGGKKRIETKKCMFSIENLAWKGVKKDSQMKQDFEIGPLGGRIMWFPPYNLNFNESVSVGWSPNEFIGRGEKVYSYSNTERTGSLSFTILVDHPSILSYWMRQKHMNGGSEEGDQEVLRFFAGCGDGLDVDIDEIIKNEARASKNEENTGRNSPKSENDKTTNTPDDTQDPKIVVGPPEEFTKENSISFYVYYPNNLSCIDFINNPKAGVNYLVNGENGFEFNPDLKADESYIVDDEGNGTALLDASKAVVGKWANDILIKTNGTGYEMGRSGNKGLTDDTTKAAVEDYNVNGSPQDNGHDYIWGYGIDRIYIRQRLCGPCGPKGDKTMKLYWENYVDSADFGLNNTPNKYDKSCDYSFMDVAEAITPSPEMGGYDYSGKSSNHKKVEKIREILGIGSTGDKMVVENNRKRKYFFAVSGGASVHGYESKNEDLSARRALFIKSWLDYCFKANKLTVDYDETSKIGIMTGIEGGEESLEVNSESAKRGRYAKAVIYWYDEDTKDATDSDKLHKSEGDGQTSRIIQEQTRINKKKENKNVEPGESTTIANTSALRDYLMSRYNEEEMFFSVLEREDLSVYKKITDKVRFFDPAFHSITPEGFNSRLSFLHQCTRQGPTISSSDLTQSNGYDPAGYAGNLSFGRPPVCVLRLGDFFNTRILITSLSIQYEQTQWDMNPEGIGVQPMLANITLGIVFQGGSSLGGPIQRLQNAVSFNYYANQEVYDDRADSAVYKDGKLSDESYVWIPGKGGSSLGEIKKMFEPKPYKNNKEDVENNNNVIKKVNESSVAANESKKQQTDIQNGQQMFA